MNKTNHLRWLKKANTIEYVGKLDNYLKSKNDTYPISQLQEKNSSVKHVVMMLFDSLNIFLQYSGPISTYQR